MRLPISKIWRAFPELDRFSDEQCRRFVKSAYRRWGVQLIHAVLVLSAWALATVAWAIMLFVIGNAVGTIRSGPRSGFLWALLSVLVFVSPLIVGSVVAMLSRDFLLRRRLRALLNDHSRCSSCRYPLLGLHPDALLNVTCPECGLVVKVDPAIVHLARDDAARPVISAKPTRE